MNRILVLGNSGSGKSTAARKIGERLALPVIHLDQHYFRAGWVEREPEDWSRVLDTLLAGDRWVMDGNYRNTLRQRLPHATHAVFLDLPRRVTLPSVLFRRVRYTVTPRPDIPEGCREKVDLQFLKYVWDYPRRSRPRILRILSEHDVPVTRLRSRRAVNRWLRDLPDQRQQHARRDR